MSKDCKCIFCQDVHAIMDELKAEIPAASLAKVEALVDLLGTAWEEATMELSRLKAVQAGTWPSCTKRPDNDPDNTHASCYISRVDAENSTVFADCSGDGWFGCKDCAKYKK